MTEAITDNRTNYHSIVAIFSFSKKIAEGGINNQAEFGWVRFYPPKHRRRAGGSPLSRLIPQKTRDAEKRESSGTHKTRKNEASRLARAFSFSIPRANAVYSIHLKTYMCDWIIIPLFIFSFFFSLLATFFSCMVFAGFFFELFLLFWPLLIIFSLLRSTTCSQVFPESIFHFYLLCSSSHSSMARMLAVANAMLESAAP